MRELLGEEGKEYFPKPCKSSYSTLPANLKKNINSAPYNEEILPAKVDGLEGNPLYIFNGESSLLPCSEIVTTDFYGPLLSLSGHEDYKVTAM